MKETKFKKALGTLDEDKSYSTEEALELILKQPKRKFQETVDISVWLGIDPKKSEQNSNSSKFIGQRSKSCGFCRFR